MATMAHRASLALLLVASLALCGAAARTPDSFRDIMDAARLRAAAENGVDKRRRDDTAYMVIRFRVPPGEADKFIDEWQKLEDYAEKDRGLMVYDLSKTKVDNVFFYHYSEWESHSDLMDHFEGKGFQKFKDYVNDLDIEWEVLPVKPVTDTKDERREMRANRGGGRRKSEEMAHVLIKYDVPPSTAEEFIDAWEEVAKDTFDEEENNVYTLRKIATSNHEYYVYGTWESYEAFRDHMESKHVRRFKETVEDQGVEWFLSPLEKYSREKE